MGINIDDIINEFKNDKRLSTAFNTYDKYINYRFNYVIRASLSLPPSEITPNGDISAFDPTQKILLDCINNSNNENNVAKLREDLKSLATEIKNKKKELHFITQNEDGLKVNIKYLEDIISIKENFIQETANFAEIRCRAKEKVQKEYYKVNKKYDKILSQLAKSKKALKTSSNNGISKQVEYLEERVLRYEAKIKKMNEVIKIAGDSKEKLEQYQSALQTSKDRLKMFNDQLNTQIKNKQEVTALISDNEKRVQLLKRNLSNLGVLSSIEKSRIHTSSNFIEDNNLKKEFLVLQNMRNEVLGSRPKGMFNPKYQKDKNFTKEEIRKYFENDEAIDSIDYLIELKNFENHSQLDFFKFLQSKNSNETNIFIKCLSTLSLDEIKKLLVHYFIKNVDLKESGYENDDIVAELDEIIGIQNRNIKTLSNNFQEFHLSIEKKVESYKSYYQGKINLLLSHLQEENNALTMFKMRQEIVNLKKKIIELEKEKLHTAKLKESPVMPESNKCLSHLDTSKLGSENMSSTKVTIHKNKLKVQKCKSKLAS